ncbi:hypothetical protein HY29_03945 [Hyphomonas beringensis]|uniref:Amidohydrolase 3 domain-containing protein n=1 Tax=Hyphomonas beringensis TaxID=1280946 RepID=A0A062U6K6_9PROT|nr:amidohydrolase family protein [Hyphomonas beringensis]KCZ53383.1 hypothetical protein HY29_03945 [Hyphomonas beringensis]
MRKLLYTAISLALVSIAQACASSVSEEREDLSESVAYDIVILNGRVVDPESGLDAIRNVGITGDQISVVTDESIQGSYTVDARGKVVAPGFIDYHAHGQSILSGRTQAFDGVTTALELEAGMLPISDYYDRLAKEGRPINYGASVSWASARIAEKTGAKPVADFSFFQNSLKENSWQEELADDQELAGIISRVEEGLDQGGLGIGFLLGYAPATGRKEYNFVNRVAAEHGVSTYTHARYLSTIEPQSSFEGFEEMIAVSAATGAHMHICHLNSISLRDIDDIVDLIDGAIAQGVNITVEAYPYGAGATSIGAALFRGPRWQQRLGGVKKTDFVSVKGPLDEEAFDELQADAPGTPVIVHFMNPEANPADQAVIDTSVLYPGGLIASDGGDWLAPTGKPYDGNTWPVPPEALNHPRSAGTFSRFLRQYVRERQAISLIDAVAKMSYLPAKYMEPSVPAMARKGRIQAGADADVVVFDLATVSDKATYLDPAHLSEGFEYVFVAGTPLIAEGKLDTNVLPGRPVRRPIKGESVGVAQN